MTAKVIKRIALTCSFVLGCFFCDGQIIHCAEAKGASHIVINIYPYQKFEVPPWIVAGCWRGYYAIDGTNTVLIPTRQNLVDGTSNGSCDYPPVGDPKQEDFFFYTHSKKTKVITANLELVHLRNYAGVFSAHDVSIAGNPFIVAYVHGENKGSGNTMLPDPEGDDWKNYFSFVSLAWVENREKNQWGQEHYEDEGPVVWPSAGYTNREGTEKLSQGVRHPSSIVHEGFIYIYYKEENLPSAWGPGREPGIKLARVRVEESRNARAYEVYHDGSWHRSLPDGLNKGNVADYKGTPGPLSTVVTGDFNTHRFSVAKVRGTDYFLGLEEYADGNDVVIALRKSFDLINWGPRYGIWRDHEFWESGRVHYPIFLDKYGWSNTEIDPDQFFILGTFSNIPDWGKISRLNVTLDCGGPSMRRMSMSSREIPSPSGNPEVYPNPFTDQVQINWPYQEPGEFVVRALTGQVILRSEVVPGVNTIQIATPSSGLVVYELTGKGVSTRGRLIGK